MFNSVILSVSMSHKNKIKNVCEMLKNKWIFFGCALNFYCIKERKMEKNNNNKGHKIFCSFKYNICCILLSIMGIKVFHFKMMKIVYENALNENIFLVS